MKMKFETNSKLYTERYVRVTDDWYPCYPEQKIQLSLTMYRWYRLMRYPVYIIKLTAFGMDDTGVEIEYTATRKKTAKKLYKELKAIYDSIPDGIDMQWFFDHGFERF